MQIPRYCIYNETNECFLSLGARLGYDPIAFLKRWFRRSSDSFDEGWWLAPPRRLKTLAMASYHDLLYLDDHQKVVGAVESFFAPRLAVKRQKASSLLVLPEHTISASRTQIGNQLVIRPPEEMESWLRKTLEIKVEDLEPGCEGQSGTPMLSVDPLPEHRVSARRNARSLCAGYRCHTSMAANRIPDPSGSGLYLVTEERWPLGTRVTVRLELMDEQTCGSADPILVKLRVARWGPDGLGLESVPIQQDEVDAVCPN